MFTRLKSTSPSTAPRAARSNPKVDHGCAPQSQPLAGYGVRRSVIALTVGAALLAACGSGGGIEDAGLEALQPTVPPAVNNATLPPTAAPVQQIIVPTSTPIPTLAPPTALPTATPTPIPPRTGNIEYTVVGGDVLGLIAERYDVTQRQILDVNPDMSASVLSVGQVIVIPPPGGDTNEGTDSGGETASDTAATATPKPRSTVAPVDTSGRGATDVYTHEVQAGQFLGTIADAFDVSVTDLVVYNGLSSANSVFIGQEILIPPAGTTVSGSAPGGTAATATPAPTADPNVTPTVAPTVDPNATPTVTPTVDPNATPTVAPTVDPNATPTVAPTVDPNATPTATPTVAPTVDPNATPTVAPTVDPNATPTVAPTVDASQTTPTLTPTALPTTVVDATPTSTPFPTPLPTSTLPPCNEVLFPSCNGI